MQETASTGVDNILWSNIINTTDHATKICMFISPKKATDMKKKTDRYRKTE